MANNNYKLKFVVVFVFLIITIVLGIGYQIFALRPPTTQPPTGGGLIGINSNAPNNSLYINASGNIGIGTTTPSKKLTVAGDLSFAGNLNLGGYVLSCELGIDCDGDGYTVWAGDCDESCSTCYPGSTSYTSSPDGKDQNCNGIIDETVQLGCQESTESVSFGYTTDCGWTERLSYGMGGYHSITITGTYPTTQPTGAYCDAACKKIGDYTSCRWATWNNYDLAADVVVCNGSQWAQASRSGGSTLHEYICSKLICTNMVGYK